MTKPKVKVLGKAAVKPATVPLNLYERLFTRGFIMKLSKTTTKDDPRGKVASEILVKDADIAHAYRLMVQMRRALALCERQFRYYGEQHKAHLDDHLSLVEKQNLEADIDRNLGIAGNLEALLSATPELPAEDWQPIATAPHDGSTIRVLGKRDTGEPYIETTRWWNIKWAIELMQGYRPPSHWRPLERLPEDFK